jgi:protein-L-isoaspartate(D-aspartate) O-methyltransferase
MSLQRQVDQAKTRPRRSSRALWSLAGTILLSLTQACNGSNGTADDSSQGREDRDFAYERARMVELQLESRGIRDERVLSAMRKVLRHRYAPDLDPKKAYEDRPHPIGNAQTISQPYIVALMSELAQVRPPCKVLEIGTGSGYQAAVLAEMGCSVYTIEIIEALADRARGLLEAEGYGERVHGRFGDGYRGWPEEAPFDAVIVTAAAPRVPEPLLDQLRVGARLVIPVGTLWQSLEVHLRTSEGFERERISEVRFVPMMGEVRD